MKSLEDLPDLPRFKMDSNQQIVIDDLVEDIEKNIEAPSPDMPEINANLNKIDEKEIKGEEDKQYQRDKLLLFLVIQVAVLDHIYTLK